MSTSQALIGTLLPLLFFLASLVLLEWAEDLGRLLLTLVKLPFVSLPCWLFNHFPVVGALGRRRRRRRRDTKDLVGQGSPQAALVLAQAVIEGVDEVVMALARGALAALDDPAAIDGVCRLWVESGNAVLGSLVAHNGWVASGPAEVRVRTALAAGRPQALAHDGPEVAAMLAALADDETGARALAGLADADARQEACRTVIQEDHPAALAVVIDAGFEPVQDVARVLLWFLGGEWERYEALDVDYSLLAEAYAAADAFLRARLGAQAIRCGRSELVGVLVGGRGRRRLAEMTDSEWEVVIAVLSGQQQGDELWALVLESPPRWGARILRLLEDQAFQPPPEDLRSYAELVPRTRTCSYVRPPLGVLARCVTTVPAMDDASARDRTFRADPTPADPCPSIVHGAWSGIQQIAIDPEGTFLACAVVSEATTVCEPKGDLLSRHLRGTLRLWSLPDGQPMAVLLDHGSSIRSLTVNGAGTILAALVGGRARLWSLPDGRPLTSIRGRRFGDLAVTPGGSVLVSALGRWTIGLSSLSAGGPLTKLKGRVSCLDALALSPDGSLMAIGGRFGTVRLWTLPEGRVRATLRGHSDKVAALAITPDGALLASADRHGGVRLWSLPEGRLLTTLQGELSGSDRLLISQDGRVLVGCGRLWSLPEGGLLGPFEGRFLPAPVIADEGTLLAGGAASARGDIQLYSLTDRRPVATIRGHTDDVYNLALTPDGSFLASADLNTVRVWDSALSPWWLSPLAAIGPSDLDSLERILAGDLTEEERQCAELIVALVRLRQHHELGLDQV